jgi:caffeoyl-CoA O-methyltransferase
MTFDPLLDIVHPQVSKYIDSLSNEFDPLVIRMTKFAREQEFPWLGHDAAKWLELLTRMVNGKRAFEFGSGFGYSAYFLARAAGEDGEVHGSDVDARMIAAHEQVFAGHPYKSRIKLHQGDGVQILASLPGTFDVIFIDLDKPYYPAALEAAVPRVRKGGLILADNVLWSGRTTAPARADDVNSAALRRFNELAHDDSRLRTAILPAGDGLSVSLRV